MPDKDKDIWDILESLNPIGMGLRGLGALFGGSSDEGWNPYSKEAWWDELGRLRNVWETPGHQTPQIFGGQYGQEYYQTIQDMISGKAATEMGGAIQRQLQPALTSQIDKLTASLNPALRGSGVYAQSAKGLRQGYMSDLADAITGLRGGMFQQGAGMLGGAVTQQAGMEQNQMMNLLQMLAQYMQR